MEFEIELRPTASINSIMAESETASKIIYDSIVAFLQGDYGPKIKEEDTKANNSDRTANYGRAIGRYTLQDKDFYIIEYYPRAEAPVLNILFCEEY